MTVVDIYFQKQITLLHTRKYTALLQETARWNASSTRFRRWGLRRPTFSASPEQCIGAAWTLMVCCAMNGQLRRHLVGFRGTSRPTRRSAGWVLRRPMGHRWDTSCFFALFPPSTPAYFSAPKGSRASPSRHDDDDG